MVSHLLVSFLFLSLASGDAPGYRYFFSLLYLYILDSFKNNL